MESQCALLFIAQTIVFKSKRIRLDLDCTVTQSWCEIDAVKIAGNWISPECMYVTFIDSDPNSKYPVAKQIFRLGEVNTLGNTFLNEAVTISLYFGCLH